MRSEDIANMKNNQGERNCALALGIIFLVIGIAGFLPSLLSIPGGHTAVPIQAEPSLYTKGYGYLFGLFPTNLIHNFVHCAVGIAGIAFSRDARGARNYCRVFAYLYAGLAILGLFPFTKTLFGLMPIFGNNVWFNGLTAALAGYFGFVKPIQETGEVAVSPPDIIKER
ncbi:conserved hypothetical protein [Gloeothece citriformis PCC 7424]|uniref:DUF4383 domain-containing protein n=1 Tax=Gloeothece citriformis (strain PCC 7424) TaxID=65393 RepID=B7K7M9_GLOC7|nr:DUF4383 domain-containing protein [Gloeothece citriformis]ACK69797.1 conserved hypothetical protein [Gloeothece citriformis PCC 7424]